LIDRSCGKIMEPFLDELARRPDLPPVQIIGGNGSAALLNPDTVIDLAARTIETPSACDLPSRRPDGSLRDMDTLVLSSDRGRIDSVEAVAEEAIGEGLKISVFGLKTVAELERQQRRPIRSTALVFVGDRYVETTYTETGALDTADGFKALFPFKAPIGADTLHTFHLVTPGRVTVPTAHPGATILNYLTRSISGVRAKDVEKVRRICQHVLSRYPDLREWIHDGPGRDSLDLARVLHTLREPAGAGRVLRLGDHLEIVPYGAAELAEHEGFMASHLSGPARLAIVRAAHVKARLVSWFEARPGFVTFWQEHLEDRAERILRNDTGRLRR
jgi:hypothetical protein